MDREPACAPPAAGDVVVCAATCMYYYYESTAGPWTYIVRLNKNAIAASSYVVLGQIVVIYVPRSAGVRLCMAPVES